MLIELASKQDSARVARYFVVNVGAVFTALLVYVLQETLVGKIETSCSLCKLEKITRWRETSRKNSPNLGSKLCNQRAKNHFVGDKLTLTALQPRRNKTHIIDEDIGLFVCFAGKFNPSPIESHECPLDVLSLPLLESAYQPAVAVAADLVRQFSVRRILGSSSTWPDR